MKSVMSAARSIFSRAARKQKNKVRADLFDALESRILFAGEPTISVISKPTAAETNPGAAGKSELTFTRTGLTTGTLDVDYSVTGTATDTDDFAHLTGTVHFDVGQKSVVVDVIPVDDLLGEGAETVIATITPDIAIIVSPTKGSATITIADNEPQVSIVALDSKSKETGDPAIDKATMKISRTGSTIDPLTVEFDVTGTAGGGDVVLMVDGNVVTNAVTIPAGKTFVTVTVFPVDDTDPETSETVIVTLTPDDLVNPTYGIVAGKNSAQVTVTDNDNVPTLAISSPDDDADEDGGVGTFTISRIGSTAGALVVNFQRTGTAKSQADFKLFISGTNTLISGNSVTIPDGDASITLELRPENDTKPDAGETATLKLLAKPTYNLPAGVVNQSATVTITDNEATVSVVALDAAAAEPGTDVGTFRITRTGNTLLPLDIKFTTTGDAKSNKDYQFIGSVFTIPAGETTMDVTIYPLIDIETNEDDETVTVTLVAGTTFSIDPANKTATVTITNEQIIPSGPDLVVTAVSLTKKVVSLNNPGKSALSVSVTNFGTTNANGVEIFVYAVKQHDVLASDFFLLGHFSGASPGYTITPGATKNVANFTTFANLDELDEIGDYYLEVEIFQDTTDSNGDNDFYLGHEQVLTVVP